MGNVLDAVCRESDNNDLLMRLYVTSYIQRLSCFTLQMHNFWGSISIHHFVFQIKRRL